MAPERIRALRAQHRWTQAALAERLGTDAVTVSRWERGISSPRPSARLQLERLEAAPPPEVFELVAAIGPATAARILRRHILLTRPPRTVAFHVPPGERLRDVERQRRAQQRLKEHMHVG